MHLSTESSHHYYYSFPELLTADDAAERATVMLIDDTDGAEDRNTIYLQHVERIQL